MNTDPGSPMSIDFLKAECINKENGLLKVRMRMALPHIYLYQAAILVRGRGGHARGGGGEGEALSSGRVRGRS